MIIEKKTNADFLACLKRETKGIRDDVAKKILSLKEGEYLEIKIDNIKDYYKVQTTASRLSVCSTNPIHTKQNKKKGVVYVYK